MQRQSLQGVWKYTITDHRPRGALFYPGDRTEPGNLWQEPERVGVDAENEYAKTAEGPSEELRKWRRTEHPELRSEKNSLEARLGIARKVAEIRQVDISPHVRTIEKRLQTIERLLADGDAKEAA